VTLAAPLIATQGRGTFCAQIHNTTQLIRRQKAAERRKNM